MKFPLALYHFCIRMMIFLVSFLTSIAYFFHNNTPKYDLSLFLTLITVLPICYCSRVAQTATDFADASHSKSAKSVTTTVSYGIFSSENAYPCTVTFSGNIITLSFVFRQPSYPNIRLPSVRLTRLSVRTLLTDWPICAILTLTLKQTSEACRKKQTACRRSNTLRHPDPG